MPRQNFSAAHQQSAQNKAVAAAAVRRTGRGFSGDSTEPAEDAYEPEPDVDLEDPSVNEDDEAPEFAEDDGAPLFEEGPHSLLRLTPIWLWRGGRIVWSADRFGYHLAQRELFRRRLQQLLDHLRALFGDSDFPEATAPLFLEGFFTRKNLAFEFKDHRDRGASWTTRLGRSALVVDNNLVPLDFFIMGQGEKMPQVLERKWLEIQVKKRGIREPTWKNFQGWLQEELNTFYAGLNACAGTDFPPYKPSTLQRKKLQEWRKWDIWSK